MPDSKDVAAKLMLDQQAFERTLNNSAVNTDTGELFGGYMTVSREVALAASPIITPITSWVAGELAPGAGRLTTWLLKNTAKLPDSKVKQYAEIATMVAGGAIALWEPILATTRITRDHWQRMSAMNDEMKPLTSALSGKNQSALASFFSSGTKNELLRYAQESVGRQTKKEVTSWMPKVFNALPTLVGLYVGEHKPDATPSASPDITERIRNFWYGAPGSESPVSPNKLVESGSGLVTEISRQALNTPTPDDEIPAWKLVKQLEREVNDIIGKDGGQIHHDRRFQRHVGTIKESVKAILIQHEANMKRSPLNSRLTDEFDDACARIAERILEGDMHPMAVAVLAGGAPDQRVIRAGGKSVIESEKLDAVLDMISERLSQQGPFDLQSFYKEGAFSKNDLKETFAVLQGPEGRERRVVLASLFDEAVLLDIGLKPEEIKSLRAEMSADVFDALEKTVVKLAAFDEKTLRRDYGLSRSESQSLKEFAGTISATRSEDEKARLFKGRSGNSIKKILANTLSTEEGKGLWTDTVRKEEQDKTPSVSYQDRLAADRGREAEAGRHAG